ncbi:hypothetical protein [Haloterrigena salifodinae]|uniref:hypothetical protein n=1 Tax=Haloterrigena salifodinae TaxID=2675099 RepID=UPI000F8786BF|nr:hypothetical protein [Haloterrigena salifodinae]
MLSDTQDRRAAGIARVAVILLLITATVPIGAAAQMNQPEDELGNNTYNNESFGDQASGNVTLGNETLEVESEKEGGGLLGGTFNPYSWLNGALEWLMNMGAGAVTAGLNFVNAIIANVPAPGTHDDPTSWTNPQNGWWPGIWEMTMWTTSLGVVLVGGAATLAFRHNDPFRRRQKLRTALIAFVMIILTWQVTGFLLHFGAQASAAFAPGGEELLGTPDGMGKILSGGMLAFILLYAYAGVIVLGLFAIIAQHVLIHLCVAFWPVAWGCKAYGEGTVASLGNFVVWLFGLLIGVNITQAMFLRLLYLLPWDAGVSGPVIGLIATIVGLGFVGVYLPWSALQTADRAANVGLGMSAMSRHKGKEHAQSANERVGHVKERVETWRGSTTDTRSGAPHSTDSPGVSSASSRRIGQVGSIQSSDSTGRYSTDGSRTREQFERDRDRGFQ